MYHLDLLRLYSSNESLKEKGCLEKLHKYAKWMQSASIPQNARLSIDDNVNIGKSPSMNNIIEKEWDKSVCNLPDFIPFAQIARMLSKFCNFNLHFVISS